MDIRDLTKTTFIIPVKIEHKDRYRNAQTTLNFLNRHFRTNVIIHESSSSGKTRLDYLDSLSNLNITLMENLEEPSFHRTKYLNQMLDIVETPVVVNYDIDVILDPENYLECQNQILSGESEVIYPYEKGMGQMQVLDSFDYEAFANSGYDINFINNSRSLFDVVRCADPLFVTIYIPIPRPSILANISFNLYNLPVPSSGSSPV